MKTIETRVIVTRGEVYIKGQDAPLQQGQRIPIGSVVLRATDPEMAAALGLDEKPKPKTAAPKGGEKDGAE